ncbi:MAG: type VI secretion system baseplate subunit TssF [Nannocystaceae bacterium]
MELSHVYERELAYLHELGRSFAAAHPQSAGLLGERGHDPDVERLIEAVAFVSAGLRLHIDRAAERQALRMIARLFPHFVRPLPAATVVELAPNLRTLRSIQRIARGKVIASRPIDGTACRFTTCHDVDLAPLQITQLQVESPARDRALLRLTLRVSDAGLGVLPGIDRLRLFVHHREPTLAATLGLWLGRYCEGITREGAPEGPRAALRPLAADPRSCVLPWPDATPIGVRTLVEGLAFPEVLGFFELSGLAALDLQGPEFTLVFAIGGESRERPPLPRLPGTLPQGLVRLHCTPALNLFPIAAEAIEHLPGDGPRLLRADGVDPRHTEVFEVEEVQIGRVKAPPRALTPAAAGPTHELERSAGVDGGIDTRLRILEGSAPAHDAAQVISTRLWATNRDLAREIRQGDLGAGPLTVLLASQTNVTPISAPLRPNLSGDRSWALVDHLEGTRSRLASAEGLRACFLLHDLPAAAGAPRGLLDSRRLTAIRGVERRRVHRLHEGAVIPVLETTIEIDEAVLSCLAEAEHLGALADRLYASMTDLGSASAVDLVLQPSGHHLRWPVRLHEADA